MRNAALLLLVVKFLCWEKHMYATEFAYFGEQISSDAPREWCFSAAGKIVCKQCMVTLIG